MLRRLIVLLLFGLQMVLLPSARAVDLIDHVKEYQAGIQKAPTPQGKLEAFRKLKSFLHQLRTAPSKESPDAERLFRLTLKSIVTYVDLVDDKTVTAESCRRSRASIHFYAQADGETAEKDFTPEAQEILKLVELLCRGI